MGLEIRQNPFEHTHENRVFRRVAHQLTTLFNDRDWNGLLVGNPYCEDNENLQIDLLLYGPEFCIIFDLKDYQGTVQIPPENDFESSPWKIKDEELSVRGGSHVNPFVQLKSQRSQALSLLKKEVQNNPVTFKDINYNHLQTAVLFHDTITLEGSIPGTYNRNFFITDEKSLSEHLVDIKSNFGFRLEWKRVLKSIFKANTYDLEIELPTIDSDTQRKELKQWNTGEQVFQSVYNFLEDEERSIHIVQGTIHSGKLSFAHSLKETLLSEGKVTSVELLTLSQRVAAFLNKHHPELTINSLYSTIYGGQSEIIEKEIDEETTEELEVIPIRSSPESFKGDTLYIILESHLLSNTYQEFPLSRFGSGHLIDDLMEFLNIPESGYKILLIGDPYQISYGSWDDMALNIDFLASKTRTKVEVDNIQPEVDDLDIRHRTCQLLRIPPKIDEELYNELWFEDSSTLEVIENKETVPSILNRWHDEDKEFAMLAYKNEDVGSLNRWFKKKILQKENQLDSGDRLLLHKGCTLPAENPFNKPRVLPNGSFVTIDEVGELKTISTTPKGQSKVELRYRRLKIIPEQEEKSVEVYLLENFLNSPKGELTKEETVAIRILLNKKINALKGETSFEDSEMYRAFVEDVKTQSLRKSVEELENEDLLDDEETKELNSLKEQLKDYEKTYQKIYLWKLKKEVLDNDPLINALYAKHGWAMTVHKALAGKWDRILLNADRGENQGIENKDYFKWLYSGLSRADEKAIVVNFEAISPFKHCSFDSSFPEQVNTTPASTSDLERILQDESLEASQEFIEHHFSGGDFSEVIKRYAYYLVTECEIQGWSLANIITKSDYLVKVEVSKGDDKAIIAFNYNKYQKVKKQARIEHITTDKGKDSLREIAMVPQLNGDKSDGIILPDDFRKKYYEEWIERLKEKDITVKNIKQLNYQDRFTINIEDDWLSFNVIYNGSGFFTKVKAFRASKPELWESVLSTIKM